MHPYVSSRFSFLPSPVILSFMTEGSAITLTFSPVDWIVVGLYLALIFYMGLKGARLNRSSTEQFLLGGRMLTLPAFVASLVATWYGGILGVGEFSYLHGLSNWFVFGFPYYVFAAVFAVFFARRVRESEVYSIPDRMLNSYGKPVSILSSVFVFFLSSPAPYFLMFAVLIQVVTGWSLVVSLLIGTATVIVYVFVGGFRSVVRTDLIQFTLMFFGFALLLGYLFSDYGFSVIHDRVPHEMLTLTGGHTWQYIAVWFFIALWTLVAPQFHQFVLSARTPTVARKGIVISIACWMVFDAMTTLSGLYARAILSDIPNATMAYPALAEAALPVIAKGLFFVGMLATIMSTTDCLTLISAMTLGRDVYARLRNLHEDMRVRLVVQYGVLVTAVVSVLSVLFFPSVIELWYVIGTLFIPGLLLPLISTYLRRMQLSPSITFTSMVLSFLVSLVWFVDGHPGIGTPPYIGNIEPMYAGLTVSVCIYSAGFFLRWSAK